MSKSNNNNCFFVEENNNDNNTQFNKKDLNSNENTRSYSFSTNETLENDEIDFNQDFFPKNKTIKFTDYLIDNWELKIKIYLAKLSQRLSEIQKKEIENKNLNL